MGAVELQLKRRARLLPVVLCALLAAASAQAEIYKWTDANGRVQFGDRKPESAASSTVATRPRPGAERLSIHIDDTGHVLDADAQQRLETGVRKIFDIYTGLFRLNLRRPVVVDIHLFDTQAQFTTYLGDNHLVEGLPPNLLGIYVPGSNFVGAWRHSKDTAEVVATLLHESSHVMLSQLAPDAPPWLQEGMAQYFEGIDPAAEGYVIHPRRDTLEAINHWIARKQLVTLQEYFSLDPQRWRHLAYAEQNPVPYVVAWSVCYFLVGKPVGRQVISELLQQMDKSGRTPTAYAIDKRYPGGYALMEYEWFKWAQGEKPPQTLNW